MILIVFTFFGNVLFAQDEVEELSEMQLPAIYVVSGDETRENEK